VPSSAAIRFLALAGGDDAALAHAKLDALRRFVLLFGAARSWLWLAFNRDLDPGSLAASAVALSGCAALAWWPRGCTWAPRLALPVLLLQLVWTLPLTNNHFFLELACVALLALVSADGDGEQLALDAIRWVTVLVLVHTGVQKVLHGLYFRGEFLAFMAARADRFADAFRWLAPADELARLAQLAAEPRAGAGPFRVASATFVVVANLVWIVEIVLGALLVPRRTRTVAAIAALGFVLAIQLGARELGFALLFANLLLVFLPRAVAAATLVPLALLFAWAVAAAFGALPGRALVEAVNL
jgi:hypothetical protein